MSATTPVLAIKPDPACRLLPDAVAKPWGRHPLGSFGCGLDLAEPVGELHHRLPASHHDVPGAGELLVKTLFTEAMLSVQVHPDAATAKAMGMASGKDEAWLVLEAAPGAEIGLGLKVAMTREALAAAAQDGSLVSALVWHKVAAGDVLQAPAGTIHAIGPGLTLLEVQQNNDVTWRLYDHGRGRRIDLEAALDAACRQAHVPPPPLPDGGPGRQQLAAAGSFGLERIAGDGILAPGAGRPLWVMAVNGPAKVHGLDLAHGEAALVHSPVQVSAPAGLIIAQSGASPQPGLWQPT